MTPNAVLELLSSGRADVAVVRKGLDTHCQLTLPEGLLTGRDEVAAKLATLTLAPEQKREQHHDVIATTRTDGSRLFAQTREGRIARLSFFPAQLSEAGPSTEVAAYQTSWNHEGDERGALLARGWSNAGRYVDPTVDATGRNALSGAISTLQEAFPGYELKAVGGVRSIADGWLSFRWEMNAQSGERIIDGFDVGHTDVTGQLDFIAGFFPFDGAAQ